MHRIRFAILKFTRHFSRLMAGLAPYAAAASAALILWHAASDTPVSVVSSPAPLVYPAHAPLDAASAAAASATPQPGAPAVQQASVAATIEVVVGRNDTLDAIFRRMALDPADLAAIRNLPGIRQSLDFLKPGDAIRLTHSDGEVKELTRKVSETQTLRADALIQFRAASAALLTTLSAPQAPATTASALVPATTASIPRAAQNSSDAPSRIAVN